jgi:hypothetical protein
VNRKSKLSAFLALVVLTLIGCAGAGVLARRLFYTNFTETFEPLRPLQGALSPPPDQVLKRLIGETPVGDATKATSVAEHQVGAPRGTRWQWKRDKHGRFHLQEPLKLYDTPEKVMSRVFPLWRFAVSTTPPVRMPPAKGTVVRNGEEFYHILYQYTFHRDFKELVIATRQQDNQETLRFLKLTFWDGDTVIEYIEPNSAPKRRQVIYTESSTGREWRFEFVLAE